MGAPSLSTPTDADMLPHSLNPKHSALNPASGTLNPGPMSPSPDALRASVLAPSPRGAPLALPLGVKARGAPRPGPLRRSSRLHLVMERQEGRGGKMQKALPHS